MNRTARIKKLRAVLADIEAKCDRCVHIGTWYCNHECIVPTAKVIAETELRDRGEYVHERQLPDR